MAGFVIAVHGGAGPARPGDTARAEARRRGLADSLAAGVAVLAAGGSSLDAVVAAVMVLEDHEEFNAGRGSVLTAGGTVEMDASVMDGATRRAGAVANVRTVRHPVAAARAVLDDGRHVLVAGAAADDFARAAGLPAEANDWFVTPRRRADHPVGDPAGPGGSTVGAVALDGGGHLAAATSTGGRSGQTPGRVGDSPIIGAGTWADDRTCAVSGTGDGEAFLRAAFAHEVDARMRLSGAALEDACREALRIVGDRGGAGGCIAVDRAGRLALPYTTEEMHRGWARAGELRIEI